MKLMKMDWIFWVLSICMILFSSENQASAHVFEKQLTINLINACNRHLPNLDAVDWIAQGAKAFTPEMISQQRTPSSALNSENTLLTSAIMACTQAGQFLLLQEILSTIPFESLSANERTELNATAQCAEKMQKTKILKALMDYGATLENSYE